MASIQELVEIQRAFDSRHGKEGEPWLKTIDPSTLPILLELTVALAGEVGEFANIAKKIARGDFGLDAAKSDLGSELADIFIYLLKLSDQLGIDLEGAFRSKVAYNEQRFAHFLISPKP
jgi:NTP pyrophosphatase (non-canonical NTP hydrolase)